MNTISVLERASNRFLARTQGVTVEQLAEQHMNDTMNYYEQALRNNETFSVVFNKMKADGTLICVGDYVQIVLPPANIRGSLSFAGRLNRTYNVQATEIDARKKEIIVKLPDNFTKQEHDEVFSTLMDLFEQQADYVRKNYSERIEAAKDKAYENYCSEMNAEKESNQIDKIMETAERTEIGAIIESLVQDAYVRYKAGESLSKEDRDFLNMIVPAKVYSIHGDANARCAIDLFGMHIDGVIRKNYWKDRYTNSSIYRTEVTGMLGSNIDVAIIGYNPRLKAFECSRKALTESIWNSIEQYVAVGDLIQVRCMDKGKKSFHGMIVGKTADETKTFNDITILCDYPDSLNAQAHGVIVYVGGIYLCKVRKINKERKFISAITFRQGGNWDTSKAMERKELE